MSLKVKESTIVYPADETPRIRLWLSSLDLILPTPYSHTRTVYIYRPDEGSKSFNTQIMKDSLSRVLVPFYPIAGRLTKSENNNRFEIDCNAAGVLYVEVETTHFLSEFEGFKPTPEFRELVLPCCDYSGGLSSFPLMMVRLTRFKCGGLCIGFGLHHHVADGIGHTHLINSWARLARGLELAVQPFHDRAFCLAPRDPPQVKFRHLEYEPPSPSKDLSGEIMASTKESLFKLSKRQIDMLKLQALPKSGEVPSYILSTFDVLAGHVWRSTCKARGLTGDENVKLYIPTDGRTRLRDPTIPKGYYGNVILFTACIHKASDITNKPLWYATSKVHESLEKVENSEYLRSAIDYLALQPDVTKLVRVPGDVTCPYLSINSWGRIPYDEVDFGWGKPAFLGHGGIRLDGQAFFVPSTDRDGSFSLNINLSTAYMPLFEKYLYEFDCLSSL